MRSLNNISEIEDYEGKAKFLKEHGWITSWDDDNWVKSDWLSIEANNGISTDAAFNIEIERIQRDSIIKNYTKNQKDGNLKPYSGKEIVK